MNFEYSEELYYFLANNETFIGNYDNKLNFGVHVYFEDIKEFIDILGHHILDDGGTKVILNSDRSVVFNLEDYFVDNNLSLEQYIDCFYYYDYIHLMKEIKKFDQE